MERSELFPGGPWWGLHRHPYACRRIHLWRDLGGGVMVPLCGSLLPRAESEMAWVQLEAFGGLAAPCEQCRNLARVNDAMPYPREWARGGVDHG